MKNTVELEQFVAFEGKRLAGEFKVGKVGYQKSSLIFFSYEKSNEIRRKSNGFIWIWDSYCSFF